ncbi:MAG: aldo/keto reductase [Planctomycetaceae bacterium]|nr:aldo/keto reductase [Planctomycetaceae bacterium]
MIAEAKITEAELLLAYGQLSQRKIAKITGLSRGTICMIANGKRKIQVKTVDPDMPPEPEDGPPVRCPGCGAMVQLPCLLCYLEDLAANHRPVMQSYPNIVPTSPAMTNDQHSQKSTIRLGLNLTGDELKRYREVRAYMDYVRQLKQEGKIRAIGASSHDPQTAMRLVETGEIEHLMFSVNLAYDMLPASVYIIDSLMSNEKIDRSIFRGIEPNRAKLYELCASRDVSITTMKTLGAGKLLSADQTPFARPMTVTQCIHYALSRPAVVSTLIGCKDRAEVLEAVRYLELGDAERDFSGIAETMRETFHGKCVYCNHCLPCPSEIDIAAVTKYLEIALVDRQSIPPGVQAHYNNMSRHASECSECASCESRCPFNVAVIENMRKAVEVFGK